MESKDISIGDWQEALHPGICQPKSFHFLTCILFHAFKMEPERLVGIPKMISPLVACCSILFQSLRRLGCRFSMVFHGFPWFSMVFPMLSWRRYVGWPAAKAHVAVLTGSLRNLQKLVTSIDDDGLLRLQLKTNCRGFHSENTAKTQRKHSENTA